MALIKLTSGCQVLNMLITQPAPHVSCSSHPPPTENNFCMRPCTGYFCLHYRNSCLLSTFGDPFWHTWPRVIKCTLHNVKLTVCKLKLCSWYQLPVGVMNTVTNAGSLLCTAKTTRRLKKALVWPWHLQHHWLERVKCYIMSHIGENTTPINHVYVLGF